MDFFTTGNEIVDRIGKISITGDVIPIIWYETVLNDRGKPAYLSILLLADILYWYKPVEVRDERTGRVIGWKKRFDGPLLQRDYKHWAAKYGESEKTIKRAMEILLSVHAIIKHNEMVEMENGLIRNNVLYWEIVPETIFQLTYPERENIKEIPVSGAYTRYRILSEEEKTTAVCKTENTSSDKSDRSQWTNLSGGIGQICPEGADKFERSHKTNLSEASGQNCPESSDNGGKGDKYKKPNGERKGSYPSIYPSISPSDQRTMELSEEKLGYPSILASNIGLKELLENARNRREYELVEDIYGLLCEVMITCQETLKINTIDQPTEFIRNRFLRLRGSHITRVVERVTAEEKCIGNMRNYLLTSLYNEGFNR